MPDLLARPAVTPFHPDRLLEALRHYAGSIAELQQHDLKFQEALRTDLDNCATPATAFDDDSATVADQVLAWITDEVDTWQPNSDSSDCRAWAVLLACQALDPLGGIWNVMSASQLEASSLVTRMSDFLAGYEVTVTADPTRGAAWERELLERFRASDLAADWIGIETGLSRFSQLVTPTNLQRQVCRALLHSPDRLVRATAGISQTIVALQLVRSLPALDALLLAATTCNPYLQFAAIYDVLQDRAQRSLPASHDEQLSRVLLKVAADASRWVAWMSVFNTYPGRHPSLQVALGRALADAPALALVAYVDAVSLHAKRLEEHAPDREAVAVCLQVFQATACFEQRVLLWEAAHKRWQGWGFNADAPGTSLLQVSGSALDYAVVAFAVESMTSKRRQDAIDEIHGHIGEFAEAWCASLTDVRSNWYRLHSRLQPYVHASKVDDNPAIWLFHHQSLSFDRPPEPYYEAKFAGLAS